MVAHNNIGGLADGLALHERAVALASSLRNVELALALVLGEMERSGAFRRFASSIADYAQMIGLGRGKGRQLCVIGRALPSLPGLHAAMADGRMGWTAAFEVARIATPHTEVGWLEVAEAWPVRELRAVVSGAAVGDPAPAVAERPDVGVSSFRFDLAPVDAQLVRRAMALLRGQHTLDASDDPAARLSDEEVLVQMAALVLQADGTGQAANGPRFLTVIRECPRCDSAELAGLADGESAAVEETTRAMARCDGTVMAGADAGSRGEEPGRGHATVSTRVRRLVMDRDNYRCAVPGCSHAVHLDVHHVVHRARGGGNELSNLVALCGPCHRRVHLGLLGVNSDGRGGFCFEWRPEGRGPAWNRVRGHRVWHPVRLDIPFHRPVREQR